MRISFLLLPLLLLMACSASRNPADQLTGRWELERVTRNGNDVTAQHDPDDDRYIILHTDGRFESGGHFGDNTGAWSIDPDTGELFIDSDAGPEDDSYWFFTVEGDVMTWTGARGFGREFVLVHRRAN